MESGYVNMMKQEMKGNTNLSDCFLALHYAPMLLIVCLYWKSCILYLHSKPFKERIMRLLRSLCQYCIQQPRTLFKQAVLVVLSSVMSTIMSSQLDLSIMNLTGIGK